MGTRDLGTVLHVWLLARESQSKQKPVNDILELCC